VGLGYVAIATCALTGTLARASDPPPPPKSAPVSPTSATPSQPPATAAPPVPSPPHKKVTQADRDAARALAEQGFEKLEQRKYDAAIDLFQKAEERFHAPTHHVYIAQAYDKKGQLIDAANAYRKVLAETLARDAPQPFHDAQTEAGRALAVLLRRTPKLRVELSGVEPARVDVVVGERKVLPGESTAWDPGTLVVRATSEGIPPAERAVELSDGGGEVVVRFHLARPMSLAWPIVAFGVGLAAGGASITTGVLSFNDHREADATCAEKLICPPDQIRKMGTARQLRDVSIATGIAGGVALLAGVTLLILRPSNHTSVEPAQAATTARAPSAGPTLSVRAGPSTVQLIGTF